MTTFQGETTMQDTEEAASAESGPPPAAAPSGSGIAATVPGIAATVPGIVATVPGIAATVPLDIADLEQKLIDAMHTIYDPEIPVDIYELGLIYGIEIEPDGKVAITMTLTTPACPVAGSMPGTVEKVARMIEGVTDVTVDLVWEPIWGPQMMTESARLQLNMY